MYHSSFHIWSEKPHERLAMELCYIEAMTWYASWHHNPRWSIIQWMAILGRSNTKDRLLRWGMLMDDQCVLCSASVANHDHLFLQCPYSAQVWKSIQMRFRFPCPHFELPQILDWFIKKKTNTAMVLNFHGWFPSLLWLPWSTMSGEKGTSVFSRLICVVISSLKVRC